LSGVWRPMVWRRAASKMEMCRLSFGLVSSDI
jgi:hypothetical protein